jgi:NitT/TauT family transport system ATP-binding protein
LSSTERNEAGGAIARSLGAKEGLNTSRTIHLDVQHVTHFFVKDGKPFEVLKDISEEIYEREFVSIIGPSGCGKSTLLYILAGFVQPSAGSVRVKGKLVQGPSRDRGFVFQQDAVFPWLTVRQNAEFGPRINQLPPEKRKELVDRYLELVELQDFRDTLPKQLSGGMRKRLEVARTFANNPDVLLMDESFGYLDAQTKENLQIGLLQLWERERTTAVFVTHDIEEAIFLADRVLVMSRRPGRILHRVEVPFGRPRALSLKISAEFQALRQWLRSTLTG